MAEVSDDELATLRSAYGLLNSMNSNPESRRHLERSIKVVKPDVETEEDVAARIAEPATSQVKALSEQVEKLQADLAARDAKAAEYQAQSETDAAFGRLAAQGYTEDGIGKIKALMVDRKIADPEAAAALFDKQNPPAVAEQPGWAPSGWNLGSVGDKGMDMSGLLKDEDNWADQQAAETLRAIRGAGS